MTLDVLAIGAHPDDVELGCGGTLALLAAAGKRTGILHLTRGEAGTRGTAEGRIEEARRAGAALGVETVDFLDCGDGALRIGPDEENALIEKLRLFRPELVFGPPASDRHPDHGRSHQLVEAACFYAGLARRGAGNPHRPATVFHYMQHDPFEARFIVDVTAVWESKVEALAAYESQLHQGDGGRGTGRPDEPPTKIASREYRAAVEGRARHFGVLIGVEFGEPFGSRLPVAVSDPWQLVPGGLR
ncbi:MAG: bacillithiol biosynthesis deacetylase BshB1 [Acidobacteriota bacterium]|nr:bacillithiol biosynthesis deacetylase BshB1 [Acidobacteriota bacterium]